MKELNFILALESSFNPVSIRSRVLRKRPKFCKYEKEESFNPVSIRSRVLRVWFTPQGVDTKGVSIPYQSGLVFSACVFPGRDPDPCHVSIPYQSGLVFSVNMSTVDMSTQERFNPVSIRSRVLRRKIIAKARCRCEFQSRINPVSCSQIFLAKRWLTIFSKFQSRINPVSCSQRGAARQALDLLFCFNPVSIRSRVLSWPVFKKKKSLFLGVSIPYQSGLVFSVKSSRSINKRINRVSIPYQSGLVFSVIVVPSPEVRKHNRFNPVSIRSRVLRKWKVEQFHFPLCLFQSRINPVSCSQ